MFGRIIEHSDILTTAVALPVFKDFDPQARIVGTMAAAIPWSTLFETNLVEETPAITVVMSSSTCNEIFTFEVAGNTVEFLGEADLHDPTYDDLFVEGLYANKYNPATPNSMHQYCIYNMTVYPTKSFEEQYTSYEPLYYALVVVAVFVFTALAFLVFDCVMQQQHNKLAAIARRQNKIMSSLFPTAIKRRLMEQHEHHDEDHNRKGGRRASSAVIAKSGGKNGFKGYLNNDDKQDDTGLMPTKPVADLFPECTVMFGDMYV
jgi:hypothetical protein